MSQPVPTTELSALVDRLFVLMRNMGSHGLDHPVAVRAAENTRQAVADAAPPFTLQFVANGLFRDRALVPLDAERYGHLLPIARALDHLGAHEVAFDAVPTTDGMVRFGDALAAGRVGPSDRLETCRIEGMRWRDIPAAHRGVNAESVEPEVFATAQVAQAIAAAERIGASGNEPWPWAEGVAVVRRLERAYTAHRGTVGRALELAPGHWTVARRAVCACAYVQEALRELSATSATIRAAAHAMLAVSLVGLRSRGAQPIATAAEALMARQLAAPIRSRSGIEPHRVRVSTVIHLLATQEDDTSLVLLALLRLVYELESLRCSPKVSFVLTRTDLLAHGAATMSRRADGEWIRLLIQSAGLVPPGAWVRLPDGRIGTVLGPGAQDDPMCPDVLVDDRLVAATGPVQLVEPPGRTL